MTRYYQTPYLKTYKQADAHEALIKPIRGSNPPIKPIEKRCRKYKAIRRDAHGNIICSLDGSDVVTYTPEGQIHISFEGYRYISQTTKTYISELLGIRCYTTNNTVWITTRGKGRYPLNTTEVNVCHWDTDSDVLVVRSPEYPKVLRLRNKVAANEKLQSHKRFFNYMRGMFKLRGDGKAITHELTGWRDEFPPSPVADKIENMGMLDVVEKSINECTEEDFYLTFERLASKIATESYRYSQAYNTIRVRKVMMKDMKSLLSRIIWGQFSKDLFIAKEALSSTNVYDPYKSIITQIEAEKIARAEGKLPRVYWTAK